MNFRSYIPVRLSGNQSCSAYCAAYAENHIEVSNQYGSRVMSVSTAECSGRSIYDGNYNYYIITVSRYWSVVKQRVKRVR